MSVFLNSLNGGRGVGGRAGGRSRLPLLLIRIARVGPKTGPILGLTRRDLVDLVGTFSYVYV